MKAVIRQSVLAAATLAALGLATSAVAGGRPDLVAQGLQQGRAHIADQLIVQFRAGASESDKQRALGRANGTRVEVLAHGRERIDLGGDVELFNIRGQASLAAAIAQLQGDGAIDYVEPNWTYQHAANSNDPQYTNGTLWGMYGDQSSPRNAFGSQAGDAASNDCGTVWVGVIDEGYMHDHVDLAANAGKNPGDNTFDGVDNDNNGYIDDVYGWDFDGNNSSVFDGVGDDHGTHVSGTIGGVGNNSTGVTGVCWSVKLMNAKFLGGTGGTTANAIKAVDYFTDLKLRHGINLVTTSNSWGGGGFSQGLADAIERANSVGILFIAAAGNDTFDCDSSSSCYPAEYPNDNVIAVASITSTGAISSFSSFGKTTVDICAPGSAIISTVPVRSKGKTVSGYATYSGTSMATPHVSGAAALYKARNPAASAAQVKAGIMNSAVATASCNGKTVSNGRLDVSNF